MIRWLIETLIFSLRRFHYVSIFFIIFFHFINIDAFCLRVAADVYASAWCWCYAAWWLLPPWLCSRAADAAAATRCRCWYAMICLMLLLMATRRRRHVCHMLLSAADADAWWCYAMLLMLPLPCLMLMPPRLLMLDIIIFTIDIIALDIGYFTLRH